ncbi:MAG: UDP-N-acetylmuramoylalanyl-D-glutamyl-2,6-diaminopimelate--D-alanyl-D-alanine ligase [Alphaproteobacteria bacterium]
MTGLWTVDALVAATGGRLRGPGSGARDITGIAIDSRTIGKGEAFFAITGDRFDGHDFAEAALKEGAALAVVSADRAAKISDDAGALVVVEDDPLDALNRLAAASRARSTAQIIAVTGSVGKTGTKEMLRAALSVLGPTHAPVGSFNNHWGVPLTLARMPADCRFGIFELGMSQPGEISPLARLVRPHIAIITTVARAHMEFFNDVAGIAAAKAEIFEGLSAGGTAILNRDIASFGDLLARAGTAGAVVRTFGVHAEADVRLDTYQPQSSGGRIDAIADGRPFHYRLGAAGRHMAQNSLAVLAALLALEGVAPDDVGQALAALSGFTAPAGRGEQITLCRDDGSLTLIDESYNANPDSMLAALALLGEAVPSGQGRRIAVLGDMLELGPAASDAHGALAKPLAQAGVDCVFLAGPHMKTLWKALPKNSQGAYADTAGGLEPILLDAVRRGDVVMIKGSQGSGLGPLVAALKQKYAACPDAGSAAEPAGAGR